MRFEVYVSGGQYRWRLIAANHRTIADSGEGYVHRQDCADGIRMVRSLSSILQFQFYQDSAREYRWRLRAANNRIVADSAEGYSTRQACEEGARLVVSADSFTPI